ncbi:probable mismatch repair endonuclease PMS2 [Coccomyxa sp. Obi]|nr:probable mismatch repair endonuclease PMS2 [Coccomyxa sp. Obi]
MLAPTIAAVPEATVHRIASGQVILDLATAVKELLENALDAGATNVEIKLKEYGSELIEVADNGCGISNENYQALTLKHHTSKLTSLADLQDLSSFGFRGEALSSLCAVAEVVVSTRTENTATGTRISYDRNGNIQSTSPIARAKGTTVAVKELFKPLPVRFKELRRHLKREFAKLLTLLQAYAIVTTGVRIICTNQVGTGPRTRMLSTQGLANMRDNIVTVFGSRTAEALVALDGTSAEGLSMHGYVSKASTSFGRQAGERQYFFLNGRPVDMPKFSKALVETYRTYTSCGNATNIRPAAFIDIRLPKDRYDINVTPDKRKALIHQEQSLLEAFQNALMRVWEPARVSLQSQQNEPQTDAASSEDNSGGSDDELGEDSDEMDASEDRLDSSLPEVPSRTRLPLKSQSVSFARKDAASASGHVHHGAKTTVSHHRAPKTRSTQPLMTMFLAPTIGSSSSPSSPPSVSATEGVEGKRHHPHTASPTKDIANLNAESPIMLTHASRPSPETAAEQPCSPLESEPAQRPCVVEETLDTCPEASPSLEEGPGTGADATGAGLGKRRRVLEPHGTGMHVDLDAIRSAWSLRKPAATSEHDGTRHFSAASLKEGGPPDAEDAASSELESIFQKSDFARMEVIGQFNLGFILARLSQEVFIVDQHAADEKYNFERLQQVTRLNRQPLLHPQLLHLTPAEAVILRDKMSIFHANGFDFKEDEGQVLLTAVPFSKDTIFGVEDVQELLHLIMSGSPAAFQMSTQASSSGKDLPEQATNVVRPSRVRAMLAMRACRSAVMIGRALTTSQMQTILAHLSTLESPWNCPHGRPTLRHLSTL